MAAQHFWVMATTYLRHAITRRLGKSISKERQAMKTTSPLAQRCPRVLFAGVCAVFVTASVQAAAPPAPRVVDTPYVIPACNDLGMHCMNSDFSEMMVLPPFNTLHVRSSAAPARTGHHHQWCHQRMLHSLQHARRRQVQLLNYWQPIFGLPAA
ncbi:MAG: hypothetical protein H6816_03695 [Phycisphaerales bacterium]|nr:hypothetical protein [Phycisphaerales bacterium]